MTKTTITVCWLHPSVNGTPLCGRGYDQQRFTRLADRVTCPDCQAALPAHLDELGRDGWQAMAYRLAWIHPSRLPLVEDA